MKIINKKTGMLVFYIFYISTLLIIFRFEAIKSNLMLVAWIVNITYFIYLILTIKLKGTWLNPNIIFMTFIFLFCYGQVFLYSLGINMSKALVFVSNNNDEIIRATRYFLFSFILFGIGLNIKKDDYDYNHRVKKEYNNSIKNVAILICITSGILYFYFVIPKLFLAIHSGYGALYKDENITNANILGYYSKFFIPSLFLLIYVFRDNKIVRNIVSSIALVVVICLLIIGGRGTPISILVTLVIIYGKYVKKYGKRDIIILICLLLVLSVIIPFIASYRSNRSQGIQNTLEKTLDNKNNPIIQTITELGGTMNAWCLTDKAIPAKQNYSFGMSYLSSVGMLVPSFATGGFSLAKYAALDIWLQNIWNMSYGPGFNIFAETYYNFGWYGGILFSFVLGYFFGTILNLKDKKGDKEKNGLLSILSIIFLYNEMLIARFPFHNTLRNFIYMDILIYIIINMVYKSNNKN